MHSIASNLLVSAYGCVLYYSDIHGSVLIPALTELLAFGSAALLSHSSPRQGPCRPALCLATTFSYIPEHIAARTKGKCTQLINTLMFLRHMLTRRSPLWRRNDWISACDCDLKHKGVNVERLHLHTQAYTHSCWHSHIHSSRSHVSWLTQGDQLAI